MRQFILKLSVFAVVILSVSPIGFCQSDLPDVFKNEPIPEQLKYLEEHTRIYENYRAIREDMFRVITKNTVDTLRNAKTKISVLIQETNVLNARIDSLRESLESTGASLEKASSTKNSISILGIEVNKVVYNSVMWTIVAALLLLLAIGYLTFKHNRITTVKTLKELDDLKAGFEEYRTKTRLEREKMNVDHFNEIQKLKGKR
ncbi:MAG: hypothetical protein JXA72_08720 [Bacteroidales bacterium]|nr:hypothetical protein [Bacteroidales bacterium]